jgi:hypothetical protein
MDVVRLYKCDRSRAGGGGDKKKVVVGGMEIFN